VAQQKKEEKMKIYLDDCGMRYKKEIVKLLENEELYNCNFHNTDYEILPSDDIYIDDVDDEILGVNILNKIQNKIEELTYPN